MRALIFLGTRLLVGLSLASVYVGCIGLSVRDAKVVSMQNSINCDDTPSVQFCDTLRNPNLYLSKVIRIEGNLGRFRNYITFYDEKCVPPHPLVDVVFDPSFRLEVEGDKGKKLEQIIEGSDEAREGKINVNVSAVGLFESLPFSERKGREVQYRFTIRDIDKDD